MALALVVFLWHRMGAWRLIGVLLDIKPCPHQKRPNSELILVGIHRTRFEGRELFQDWCCCGRGCFCWINIANGNPVPSHGCTQQCDYGIVDGTQTSVMELTYFPEVLNVGPTREIGLTKKYFEFRWLTQLLDYARHGGSNEIFCVIDCS